MKNLRSSYHFVIFSILIFSLITSSVSLNFVFAEDESEKKRLEEQREQEKKEKERLEEQRKKAEERAREERKKFEENLRESLKIEFEGGDLESGNFADWVLIGTVILIIGVIGSTGYKIIKPKKRKVVSTK